MSRSHPNCKCFICTAADNPVLWEDAEQQAEQALDDLQFQELPGSGVDFTPLFDTVVDSVKSRPVFAAALLKALCERHDLIRNT